MSVCVVRSASLVRLLVKELGCELLLRPLTLLSGQADLTESSKDGGATRLDHLGRSGNHLYR